MQAWKDYQEKNKDRFLDELLELLRIPSVSARSEHKGDMIKCAEAVKERLLQAGADKVEIFETCDWYSKAEMSMSSKEMKSSN